MTRRRPDDIYACPPDASKAEVERLLDWLYYIRETTSDHNVLAAVELAEKGEAVEWGDD